MRTRRCRHAAAAVAITGILAGVTEAFLGTAYAAPPEGVLHGRHTLSCHRGTRIMVDFDHGTVTDSVSDTPVAAKITADEITWHNEFTAYQFDPHYGAQIVHHTADHKINRHTGGLTGGDVCDIDQK
jgi:hypothetical protein